jgi:hypothetical protein
MRHRVDHHRMAGVVREDRAWSGQKRGNDDGKSSDSHR